MHIKDILSIEDVDFTGKTVLMRVDYNVPYKGDVVSDDTRIRSNIPTIDRIFERGAKKIVLMSHLGRPDGQRLEKFSLKVVVNKLKELSKREVTFVNDCVGPEVETAVKNATDGSLVLLENLRFYIEEEGKGVSASGEKIKADPEKVKQFREQLTRLGDIYVNDAFGTAHRAHSSMVGINLPIRCCGLLMHKELMYFSKALEDPKKPFLSILGGAKVRDKIQLIENLLNKVDHMIIGGGMAWTFLNVLHKVPIGNSLFDEEGAKIVPEIIAKAKERNVDILLPCDFVISDRFGEDGVIKTVDQSEGIPSGFQGLDCGPRSREKAAELIRKCKTIVWNGPLGVSEMKSFAGGSIAALDAVIEATKQGACTIIGGGDTAALVQREKKADQVSHVSTGGGASLELLEGKVLPGVAALCSKH